MTHDINTTNTFNDGLDAHPYAQAIRAAKAVSEMYDVEGHMKTPKTFEERMEREEHEHAIAMGDYARI